MKLRRPFFIGFRAKDVHSPPGFPHPEVCSVGDCVNEPTPDWDLRWDWNEACCYNTETEAWTAVPEDLRHVYCLFAYRMFRVEFTPWGQVGFRRKRSFICGTPIAAEPDLTGYKRIGYDVASASIKPPKLFVKLGYRDYNGCIGLGHSPLSCSGCDRDIPTNKIHLIDDLQVASRLADFCGLEQPKRGSYFVYEVLRKL